MRIDFHSHVLPGIDDGSQHTATTQAMLEEEVRQGVDAVVATPHFYASEVSVEHFITRRNNALKRAVSKIGGTIYYDRQHAAKKAEVNIGDKKLTLLLGGEVYYFPGIGDAEMVPRLCTEGTRTLLLEMPFAQWDSHVVRDVEKILRKQKLKIVIAHVERYYEFQRNLEFWDEVMSMPIVPQINAGTFIGNSGGKRGLFGGNGHAKKKKKWALDFVREHPDFIIASDAHNLDTRRPNIEGGEAVIREEFGEEEVQRMYSTAVKALDRK